MDRALHVLAPLSICSGSSGDFFIDNERLLCCRAEATQGYAMILLDML